MTQPDPKYIAKFAQQLGDVSDFVIYVRGLEKSGKLGTLSNFVATMPGAKGKRYLMLESGVIDFRHFFAAMAQRTSGALSKSILGVGATNVGDTLMLGVLNEVKQCIGEAAAKKMNSCFSKEDLHSNRLGADFGELLVIKRAERSVTPVANLLETFLKSKKPMPSSQVQKLRVQGDFEVVGEALSAVLRSISDFLIPSAY